MSTAQKEIPTTCAACGGTLHKQRYGKYQDFCSIECRNMGRAYCKQCGAPLVQGEKGRKDFCNNEGLCQRKYLYGTSPLAQENRDRTTCKCGCGMPIVQPKNGYRQFYNRSHAERYRRLEKHKLDLTQRWGGFAPNTRKAIMQVEQLAPVLASQLASAIDSEYMLRHRSEHGIYGHYVQCRCKTCKSEFWRQVKSSKSRDYCNKCLQTQRKGLRRGENNPRAKLTWEQVDEIRLLYATEHLTQGELASRYKCNKRTISAIVLNHIWKPEHDPRRHGEQP